MRPYAKIWIAAVAICLAILILAAAPASGVFPSQGAQRYYPVPSSFSGTMSLVPHVALTRGRLRLFWTLIATGITFWFTYQLYWTYYEVWLRTDVPDLWAADIVIFLHIVPLMAALALRPHAPQDEYAAKLRRLDFALMMIWWGYLYILIVIPWQYVMANVEAYNSNLNSLYLIEKLAFLGTLLVSWIGSKGRWRTFYASLFGASLIYAASSYVANWALDRHSYYSGSLYDIPLAISMAWITVIGLRTRDLEPQAGIRTTSTSHGVRLARVGMIAAFSVPLFAAWALLDESIPPRIRWFRVVLTLGAALLMGVMVFVRQRLLDRELVRLLSHSRESIGNLKRLQAQITESEKMASIGHLLGGAAHELNNPITAMLGYSDLLMSTSLTPEQSDLAGKVGQHVRRTRSLVASLLELRQTISGHDGACGSEYFLLRTAPSRFCSLNGNRSISTCALNFRTRCLLLVRGDSNQLLQVCVHDY